MSHQVSQSNNAPVLCANNCGFFGNPKTENYCSMCFKNLRKDKTVTETKEQQGPQSPQTAPQSPSSSPAASTSPLPSPASSPLQTPIVSQDAPVTMVSLAPLPSPSSSSVSQSPAPSPSADSKPQQLKKNRCFSCNKKVGVLGFECRCDYVFCGDHRLPQFHSCTYDMKKQHQEQLKKLNPKVESSKIDKI